MHSVCACTCTYQFGRVLCIITQTNSTYVLCQFQMLHLAVFVILLHHLIKVVAFKMFKHMKNSNLFHIHFKRCLCVCTSRHASFRHFINTIHLLYSHTLLYLRGNKFSIIDKLFVLNIAFLHIYSRPPIAC